MFGESTGGVPDFAARLRKMRIISGGVVLLFMVAAVAIISLPPLITYESGTPTTAHVGHCATTYHSGGRHGGGHTSTTCTGTWTINGVRHSGQIEGATQIDEGEDIPVHATDGTAATAGTVTNNLGAIVFVLGIGVVVFVFSVFAPARVARFRTRPPYGAGPYGPGPYGPGPYQAGPYGPGSYQQGGYGQGTYGQAAPGPGPYQQGPYGPGPGQPGPPPQGPPQQGPPQQW